MVESSFIPFKKPGTKTTYTNEQMLSLVNCANDPFYFLKHYVKVQTSTMGAVNFILYDYQVDIINALHNYKDTVVLAGRQLGKTTSIGAYLLWYALFNADKTVLIVANKLDQAIEIMDRIRYSYEELPDYIRDSATEYNKKSIKFSNGSKIICRATTPDAGRGLSISFLYIDELSFVRPTIQEKFWTSIQPTLATGGKCAISSTPISDTDIFAQIWLGAENKTDEHGNISDIGSNGFKAIKAIWSQHPDRNEEWANKERAKIGHDRFAREHECIFLAESDTLINPHTLTRLRSVDPVFTLGSVRWYKKIDPNCSYFVFLDPSSGVGRDSAAIQIFEMPSMIQCGEWKHNKTPPKGQVQTLLSILRFINSELKRSDPELYWSFENNSVGEGILQLIFELGEDKFPGSLVNEPKLKGHARKIRRGFATTNRSKILACTKLKSFVDSDKFKINSEALIYQLKNYVAIGTSFAGKPGINDDLVAALLGIVRLLLFTQEWGTFSDDLLKESFEDEEFEAISFFVGNYKISC